MAWRRRVLVEMRLTGQRKAGEPEKRKTGEVERREQPGLVHGWPWLHARLSETEQGAPENRRPRLRCEKMVAVW